MFQLKLVHGLLEVRVKGCPSRSNTVKVFMMLLWKRMAQVVERNGTRLMIKLPLASLQKDTVQYNWLKDWFYFRSCCLALVLHRISHAAFARRRAFLTCFWKANNANKQTKQNNINLSFSPCGKKRKKNKERKKKEGKKETFQECAKPKCPFNDAAYTYLFLYYCMNTIVYSCLFVSNCSEISKWSFTI